MLSVKAVDFPRFGYYVILPYRQDESDGFIMPGHLYDLDFVEDQVVIFRDSGNMKFKIDGSEHLLVPHENVYASVVVKDEELKDEKN